MDFSPTPEYVDASDLAAQVLARHASPERLREVDSFDDRFDPELWAVLGQAGILGLAVPEEHSGAGLGVVELTGVLEQLGRHVAPVPLAHHYAATLAIARFGTPELKAEWLPRAASGEALLTVATSGPVVAAPRADAVVSASGPGVVLVTDAEVTPQTLSTGQAAGSLAGGTQVPLTDDRAWVSDRLTVLLSATQLGVVEGALALTASYAGTREQFGRPIGTFQAVSQRLADGYIDVLGLRLTVQQAAWRLSEGLASGTEVATAAMWAADAGHRLAHTTVHVHGGVGIDMDGEAHRYFTRAKELEFLLGGSTAAAIAIGRELAAR